ncbi:MAG: cyclase family protein [Acidobacteriota bacterium]|nr:MAG: cyclase family protein [Acidobacteriota bacterium]
MGQIYDVTALLHEGTANWPGDTPFSRDVSERISEGSCMNLSRVEMSLHTGTHMDAPWHYADSGVGIDEVPLEACLGRALLVSIENVTEVQVEDVKDVIRKGPERVLFRFDSQKNADIFRKDFTYFSAEAARALGEAGVRLIGTDSASVDIWDSKTLPAHRAFNENSVFLLENLVLNGVPDGEYELIVLPLRIRGGDGSPVRAVLRTL